MKQCMAKNCPYQLEDCDADPACASTLNNCANQYQKGDPAGLTKVYFQSYISLDLVSKSTHQQNIYGIVSLTIA